MTAKPAFSIAELCDDLRLAAIDLQGQEADAALSGARLVDGLREAGLAIPSIDAWARDTNGFAPDAWQRLEILVHLFRESRSSKNIAACLATIADPARNAFLSFCQREAQLLTLDLLLKSPFRVEEMARKWVDVLGGTFAGEKPKESQERLERLDFGGVLKNLKAADSDRAQRMKKMQQIEAKRLKEQQEAYERSGRE